MTLARAKALNWGFNEQLTSAQINFIDSQLPYAVDGHAGGTYAPAPDPIIIGGSGLYVSGPFSASSSISLDGVAQVTVSLTIDGPSSALLELTSGATLQGDAGAIGTWAGAWTFTGSTTLGGATTVDVALTIDGGSAALLEVTSGGTFQAHSGSTTTFENAPTFSNGFVTGTAGSATFGRPAIFNGTMSANSVLALGSGGYIQHRHVSGQNATHTYNVATEGDRVIWGTLTADHDATIADATEGAEMIVALDPTGSFAGHRVTVKRADTSVITYLEPIGNGAGKYSAGRLLFTGGSWLIHSPTINPS